MFEDKKFTILVFEKNNIVDNKIIVQYFLSKDYPSGKWMYDHEAQKKFHSEEYDLDDFIYNKLKNFSNSKNRYLFTNLWVQKAHIFVFGNATTLHKMSRLIDKSNESTEFMHESSISTIEQINANVINEVETLYNASKL